MASVSHQEWRLTEGKTCSIAGQFQGLLVLDKYMVTGTTGLPQSLLGFRGMGISQGLSWI